MLRHALRGGVTTDVRPPQDPVVATISVVPPAGDRRPQQPELTLLCRCPTGLHIDVSMPEFHKLPGTPLVLGLI